MKVISIILGILLIMAGIFMVMTPGITYTSMSWMIGCLLILAGANGFVQYFSADKTAKKPVWELIFGILSLILGGIVLINPMTGLLVELALTYAFDFWLILGGITRVGHAFTMRKNKERNWGWSIAMGILSVVVGVYALFHIGTLALAIGMMVGVAVMMSGFNLISGSSAFGGSAGGGAAA